MAKRLVPCLILMLLTGGITACNNTVALDPETETPLVMNVGFYPSYAGTPPSRYDGTYEGNFWVDVETLCQIGGVSGLMPFEIVISNGKLLTLTLPVIHIDPIGYVNNRGVFYAMGDGERLQATIAVSGRIKGDRAYGLWQEWGWLCSGHFEVIRETGGRYYCVNRFTGKPYSSGQECRQSDEILTKAEFESGCRPKWVPVGMVGYFEEKCGFAAKTK